MLRHYLRGLSEEVVVTHRRTGARAVVTVTAAAPPGAGFRVGLAADPCFTARRAGDWHHLRCRGALACWWVGYAPQTLYPGLPTVFVEAPWEAFDVAFRVVTPHPDFPDGLPPGRPERRHAGT